MCQTHAPGTTTTHFGPIREPSEGCSGSSNQTQREGDLRSTSECLTSTETIKAIEYGS